MWAPHSCKYHVSLKNIGLSLIPSRQGGRWEGAAGMCCRNINTSRGVLGLINCCTSRTRGCTPESRGQRAGTGALGVSNLAAAGVGPHAASCPITPMLPLDTCAGAGLTHSQSHAAPTVLSVATQCDICPTQPWAGGSGDQGTCVDGGVARWHAGAVLPRELPPDCERLGAVAPAA